MAEVMGSTEIFGIIGYPVTHSLSPLMHNYAFELCDLDMQYVPFEVRPDNLSDGIKGLKALGIKGINVTVPHKESVIPFCAHISDTARIMGAVNTISIKEDSLIGDNTDADGFINAWREEVGSMLEEKQVIILGAGGSARAVYYAIAREKVKKITILNRSPEKGEKIHRFFQNYFPGLQKEATSLFDEQLPSILTSSDIIINCTPVGMHPEGDESPIALPSHMRDDIILYDLIYNPPETAFLREGKNRGLRSYNGLGMLLCQGALSFEIWTGNKFPLERVKRYIKENLKL